MGRKIWGRQLPTRRGAEIGVPKRGVSTHPKMSQNGKYPQGYFSMMAWRRDSNFGVGPHGSPLWAHTYLGPRDLHVPWHADSRNCTHKCQNAPCEWALRFANVACESWRPMCISYIPYVVHWSMRPACTGGAEHSARRAKNIGNCRKWPKLRILMVRANGAHVQLGPGCALELEPSAMCPAYLLGVDQTLLDLGMAGSPSEPMILD